MEINPRELVCGDIVKIKEGLMVTSDGIMIESRDVATDESAMTGETNHIKKGTLE